MASSRGTRRQPSVIIIATAALVVRPLSQLFKTGKKGSSVSRSSLSATPVFRLQPDPTHARVGIDYHYTFAASSNLPPVTFAVVGGWLPTGLTLDPDGRLHGAPTSSGTFTFAVRATDANTQSTVRSPITIPVRPAPGPLQWKWPQQLLTLPDDEVQDYEGVEYFQGQPFSKSKTQAFQDLIGIIAAIGLAFALLTLIAGDQLYRPIGTGQSWFISLAGDFHVLGPGMTAKHSVADFFLLVLVTWRFYFFNIRSLGNRYGAPELNRVDWVLFSSIDVPAIMLEGLVFAAMGLLVNNAFLFIVFLGAGLGIDAVWNGVSWVLEHTGLGGSSRWNEVNEARRPRAVRKNALCFWNNGIVTAYVVILAFEAHGAKNGFQLTDWKYGIFVAMILVNCAASMFGYNKDLFLDPRK